MAARNLEIPLNPPNIKLLYKSFQNNSIWLPNDSGSVANGEMCYESSTRVDQKRPHQWFTDSSEQELLLSKKQAVEPFKGTSGPAVVESTLWHDGSHFQSGSQSPSLYNPKPVRSSNVSDSNMPPVTASLNMEKNVPGNQFENDPSVCLTSPHAVDDSLCLNSGPRKVKVYEVQISENCLPEFVGSAFSCGEKNEVMATTFNRTCNNMLSGPIYNTAVGNAISVNPAFSSMDKNFVSVGQHNKRDGNLMLTNQFYNRIDSNVLSMSEVINRGNYNINALGEQYEKDDGSFSSICPTYNRVQENLFSLDPFYSKVNETFMSACPNKGETHIDFEGQQDATVASLGTLYNRENSSILSMVEHSRKGEETTISFGGFQNNVEERDHTGRLISSYDVLLNQSSARSLGALGQKDSLDKLTANAITASSSRADGGVPKNKDQKTKKGSSNNFPSNVKSLLSTGILDGIPVKYVSWSREKNLRGVVKGTGYMCSCQECKLSKTINAFEFERHAGCKTKHPNNHIYFENGKTIYAVVQELKSTPQDMLFDVIQNVTGSAVNQKNFNTWKASYQAATRELQRIYGKDDLVVPS